MVDLHYILLKINNAEDFDLEYVHQNTSYGTINRDFLKKGFRPGRLIETVR